MNRYLLTTTALMLASSLSSVSVAVAQESTFQVVRSAVDAPTTDLQPDTGTVNNQQSDVVSVATSRAGVPASIPPQPGVDAGLVPQTTLTSAVNAQSGVAAPVSVEPLVLTTSIARPQIAPDVIPEPRVAPTVIPQPRVAPSVTSKPRIVPSVSPEPLIAPSVTPEPRVVPSVTPKPLIAPSVTPEPRVVPSVIPKPRVVPTAVPQSGTSPTINPQPVVQPRPLTPPPVAPPPGKGDVGGNPREHTAQEKQLGNRLYFDTNLSEPNGQACASCHVRSAGRADPDRDFPISEGVIPTIWGIRNAPSTGYTMFNPRFQFESVFGGRWVGGQLLDGRATGDVLGDPLADQALGPFLNPLEMNNPDKVSVVRDAVSSQYSSLFQSVCGTVDLNDAIQVDEAFNCIATSIAAFERTREFAKFNSQYDKYLKKCIAQGDQSDQSLRECASGIGEVARAASHRILNDSQWKGLQLFNGFNNNDGVMQPGEGAACAACHTASWTDESDYELKVEVPAWSPQGKVPPLFTDFTYHNIGIPKNNHPLLSGNPTDLGLGGRSDLLDPGEHGKFKVSSLRNIWKSAPYGHNGIFETLKDYTNFYSTRDVGSWPAPEVPDNMHTFFVGNLGLSSEQEQQLVDFMRALTDGAF